MNGSKLLGTLKNILFQLRIVLYLRRELVSKYHNKVPLEQRLSYVPHGLEIKMAWEEHRAIICLYFAILAMVALVFLGEEAR